MRALFVKKERDKERERGLERKKNGESARGGDSHDLLDLRMKGSKLNEMSRWNDATMYRARDLALRGINERDLYGRNLNYGHICIFFYRSIFSLKKSG